MNKRQVILLAFYGVLLLTSAVACFSYPDDKVLPLALASFFGPFMAISLGFGGAVLILFLALGLTLPFVWRSTSFTLMLLVLGIVIWGYSGYVAGGLLYA